MQIRTQELLSDEAVSIVAEALEVHREDIERGALLSIDEGGTRVRMLPLKRSQRASAAARPLVAAVSKTRLAWVTTAVPELRIVDDELWSQVKARQVEMRRVTSSGDPKRFNQARRPKYLFSGLTKCAECGGGYVMYWRDRLACFGARSRGTCTNRLTISRQEVEDRVLVALRDELMRRDLFDDFCREYVRELNRLRMEHRAGLSSARSKLVAVEREIRKLVQAIKDGVSALSIKDELLSLEIRKAELQSRLDAPEMPELLHPRMADVYREKVGSLSRALESEESRAGAVEAIRALIETILLEPDGNKLKITLKGGLTGMLSAARDSKRSPDSGDLLVQIKLVAGARSKLYRQLCWAAA